MLGCLNSTSRLLVRQVKGPRKGQKYPLKTPRGLDEMSACW